MRLYATIQSERATKGQGGEYLKISIKGKDKSLLWSIKVDEVNDDYVMQIWNEKENKFWDSVISDTKGKKETGKKCLNCNTLHSVIGITKCLNCDKPF